MRCNLRPVLRIAWYSMRIYFAPLVGAVRGIRHEYRRLGRIESSRHSADAQRRRCA